MCVYLVVTLDHNIIYESQKDGVNVKMFLSRVCRWDTLIHYDECPEILSFQINLRTSLNIWIYSSVIGLNNIIRVDLFSLTWRWWERILPSFRLEVISSKKGGFFSGQRFSIYSTLPVFPCALEFVNKKTCLWLHVESLSSGLSLDGLCFVYLYSSMMQ